MQDDSSYCLNYPHVVAEAFDGEWVIVHLTTGTYFSLDGTAATLWPWVISGVSLTDAISGARSAFPDAGAGLAEDIRGFVSELLSHDLIRELREAVSAPLAAADAPDYSPPVIGVHADLQDILLLDPVHDVDAAGWPIAAMEPLGDHEPDARG